MDSKRYRYLLNHPRWPSPEARVVAKNIARLQGDDIVKRMTHEQALDYLARRSRMSLDEFLALPKQDAWFALGCTRRDTMGRVLPFNPLYGCLYRWW